MSPPLLPRGAVCAIATAIALVVGSCATEGAGSQQSAAPAHRSAGDADAKKRLRVAQFDAPRRFWCLVSYPRQAQITLGWSVPAATDVTVELDGKPLREGIRRKLPFHVLAGSPAGIGTTVVFACRSGKAHTITIHWRKGDSKAVTRTLRIRKAGRR